MASRPSRALVGLFVFPLCVDKSLILVRCGDFSTLSFHLIVKVR
jgi:hypothetical protein